MLKTVHTGHAPGKSSYRIASTYYLGREKKVGEKNEKTQARPLCSSDRKEMLVGSESLVKGGRDFSGNG